MAVSNLPLNRSTSWTTDQKQVLRKVFQTAQAAAVGEDSSLIAPNILQRQLANKLPSTEYDDVTNLMREIRTAIDAQDPAYDFSTTISTFRMEGNKRRILRQMAQEVVDQVVEAT